jgi:Na+/H+ antiporter NhaA
VAASQVKIGVLVGSVTAALLGTAVLAVRNRHYARQSSPGSPSRSLSSKM